MAESIVNFLLKCCEKVSAKQLAIFIECSKKLPLSIIGYWKSNERLPSIFISIFNTLEQKNYYDCCLVFFKNLFVLAAFRLKTERVSGDVNVLYVDLAFLCKATIFEHSAVQNGFEIFFCTYFRIKRSKVCGYWMKYGG